MDCPWWLGLSVYQCTMRRMTVRLKQKGLEPNVAGDQVFNKPNTKQTQISFDLQH